VVESFTQGGVPTSRDLPWVILSNPFGVYSANQVRIFRMNLKYKVLPLVIDLFAFLFYALFVARITRVVISGVLLFPRLEAMLQRVLAPPKTRPKNKKQG